MSCRVLRSYIQSLVKPGLVTPISAVACLPIRRWLRLSAGLKKCAALLLLVPVMTWATPFAYIPNHGANTVSVIDTASNTVTTTITVGSAPYGVAVNPASTRVYVTNETSNTVSVIDTATNTVTATIPVGVTPEGVAVNPAGTRVYVANWNSYTVSVINTATNAVIATIPVAYCPAGVAVNPAGTTVYVTNECVVPPSHTSGVVTVIDAATNTVTTTIPNLTPEGVAVNPAGTLVYVADQYTDMASVIDTTTNTVTATISVGSRPEGVAMNPSGTLVYVANRTLSGVNPGTVSVIDTATNTVTTTISVGIHPVGVAVNPAGTRVYVANEGSNNVMAIDTATNAVVATVTVGSWPRAYGKFIADIAAPTAPTKVTITSVNGGVNPTVGSGFSVVVQAQDGTSTPQNVATDTAVTLSLLTGTGALGGTLGCTIPAGSNTCTVTGVTYSVAEGDVSLTATRTGGDMLTAGNSAPFAVNAALASAVAIPSQSELGLLMLSALVGLMAMARIQRDRTPSP